MAHERIEKEIRKIILKHTQKAEPYGVRVIHGEEQFDALVVDLCKLNQPEDE